MFQPFLRFYRRLPSETIDELVQVAVSTLLEILLLVCSVLVGFKVFLLFFVSSAVGLELRFTFISHGVG
jgi:hypothetical protein